MRLAEAGRGWPRLEGVLSVLWAWRAGERVGRRHGSALFHIGPCPELARRARAAAAGRVGVDVRAPPVRGRCVREEAVLGPIVLHEAEGPLRP